MPSSHDLPADFLKILADPIDHTPLVAQPQGTLRNPVSGREYPVEDGIVLLDPRAAITPQQAGK